MTAKALTVFFLFPVLLAAVIKYFFGQGQPFLTEYKPTAPILSKAHVTAIPVSMPPGCITISPIDGRVFFDTHPFANPKGNGQPSVFELLPDNTVKPWPSLEAQSLFVAPFGITTDAFGRVWFIEPAALDRASTRILGLNVTTGDVILDHTLPPNLGRFAQDLRVSPDGHYLVLADTGVLKFTAGNLIVFCLKTIRVIRVIYHPEFRPQDYFIRRWDGPPHRVFWGLISFHVGLDGIAFSQEDGGMYLYLGTMTHNTMFKIPTKILLNPQADDSEVVAAITPVSAKPQSDGLAVTAAGTVLITDIEGGGIVALRMDGSLQTLTKDPSVVWADSVEVYGDTVVFTDSALPAYIQQTMQPPDMATVQAAKPFHLYRFSLPKGL